MKGEEEKTMAILPKWFWKQSYEMPDGSLHWALCDTDSEKEGKVSCCYMVLLADYATCSDGLPVSEQPLPKRIVTLLNRHGYSDAKRQAETLRRAAEAAIKTRRGN